MPIQAHDRSLPDWFTRIRTRQIVLPRFQRFEAWTHAQNTQLFNTILQDLPIGAVLVLEIGNEEPFISRTLVGAPETGERITENLLDGQQRLTALWRGLNNNYDDRTYFLHLQPDEETGMPYHVESLSRWRKADDTQHRPFWANDPKEQWKKHMVPLDLCAPGESTAGKLKEWLRLAMEDRDERDEIKDVLGRVREKFLTFNLPFLALPVKTKKETALDVFIKMNTSAEPLSIYDIVVAQVEAGLDVSLHDLVAETRSTCPTLAAYTAPEDLALAASALLQGRAPNNNSYMAREFGPRLIENWRTYLVGASRAIAFLEEERVFDAARLPTDVVPPVLVALWAIAPEALDAAGRARTVLKKYLWRAFFTDRYEKATATRALTDFNELRAYIEGSSAVVPAIFDEEQYPLPQQPELIAASWPKRKDRLARAVLAVALRKGGLDLADGGAVSRANLAKREYHHLFPEGHLRDLHVADDRIYRALNCAVVTWQTNRAISDKKPERYLAERRERTKLGAPEIRARLASHLIPYDEMVAGDYEAFLAGRADLVHAAMTTLCTGAGLGE